VRGLRARGGYEVDVAWRDGKLASAVVRNVSGAGDCRVRLGAKTVGLQMATRNAISLDASLKAK
jgi:alpha-L-fucosidase 2